VRLTEIGRLTEEESPSTVLPAGFDHFWVARSPILRAG
jgi:hypothetical protein